MLRHNRLLSWPLLALLTACGGIPTQKFEFDAIDASENPRPCLVVVNDDWVGAAEKNQFVNVAGDDSLTLELVFQSAEVEVTMAPVLVEGGAVARVPKSRKEARDYTGFMDETRRLMLRDPKRQLFILPRRTGSS